MAAAPFVSLEDYLNGGYEAEWEYVDGQLVPRRSGNALHAQSVVAVGASLSGRSSFPFMPDCS